MGPASAIILGDISPSQIHCALGFSHGNAEPTACVLVAFEVVAHHIGMMD